MPTYDCPFDPVALRWLGNTADADAGLAGLLKKPVPGFDSAAYEVYAAYLRLAGCEPGVDRSQIIVRGQGPRSERPQIARLFVSGGAEEGEDVSETLLAVCYLGSEHWNEAYSEWVWDADVEDHPTIYNRTYVVVIEDVGGPRHEDVTLEFQYECPCSNWNRVTQQTMDHELLDLRFEPEVGESLRTDPLRPSQGSPFRVLARVCYDWEQCLDPLGESGLIYTRLVIDNSSGYPVYDLVVTLPSIVMEECEDIELLVWPGGLDPGRYEMRVTLNDFFDPIECGPEGPNWGNNIAQGEFEVDPCTCPPHLGDLALYSLDLPDALASGTTVEATWTATYDRICDSVFGESGAVSESLRIESAEEELLIEMEFAVIDTILMGYGVHRREAFPVDLPPGEYTLTLILDPSGAVEECVYARETNQVASVSFEVLGT